MQPLDLDKSARGLSGQAWREDLRLYGRLIGMQIRSQLQYRVTVMIDIFTYLAVTGLEYIAVVLYYSRFPTILGWKVGEVTLLAALVSIGYGIAELVGAGIDSFDQIIRRGEFDRVLLRPIGTFTQVIGSDFRLRRLGRIGQGLLLFPLALHLLSGSGRLSGTPLLTWDKLLVIVLGLGTNAAIFIGILLMGAALCFWTIETTELVNIPVDGGRELSNYPLTIYPATLQRIFLFVVPLAFGAYLPACYVLHRPLPFGLPGGIVFVAPSVALAFLLAALGIWRFGVRHYQSTGS